MEKKCIYCNDPLDIKLHGLTKYCSAKCRNKDYYLKKKSDESKNTIELQSNEKLPETNFRQMDKMNEIKKENNFIEPNKDYYTLYLEEKHARHIEQLENYYFQKDACESLNKIKQKMDDKENRDNEIEEEPQNKNILNNLISGISEIGRAYLENREKNTKIVQM